MNGIAPCGTFREWVATEIDFLSFQRRLRPLSVGSGSRYGFLMITNVASAVLYVSDQDAALAFYRDVLAFEVVTDVDMGQGARWLEVRPSGAQTSIVLSDAAAFGRAPGDGAHLTFASPDVAATVRQLRERGAVVSDPTIRPWGDLRHRQRTRWPQTSVQRTPGPGVLRR
ncbi:VOC family protein [Streptomyces sp. NPDC058045]|uniref:VOC family protein n=1 Tax=Streptomyces sp. NPDC058045 TaxID=3346311 RepID=UPI0036E51B5F